MLEQNLLDNIDKVSLRRPLHTLLEIVLIIGHGLVFLYGFYQTLLMGLSVDLVWEFIPMLLSTFSVAYIYSWHRFSVLHGNSSKKTTIPVYLFPLRFMSFSMSGFLGFIAFFFVNFEDYRFDVTPETAQLVALFFATLAVLQFIYTLLTSSKSSK
jgi:hypothetical protein